MWSAYNTAIREFLEHRAVCEGCEKSQDLSACKKGISLFNGCRRALEHIYHSEKAYLDSLVGED